MKPKSRSQFVNIDELRSGLRSDSRGTALIEMIVVGFVVALITLPVLLTVVRMADASDVAGAEARSVAEWVARHGVMPSQPMSGDVHVDSDGSTVTVSSTIRVDVLAIGGTKIGTDVSATYAIPIAPYRSDR